MDYICAAAWGVAIIAGIAAGIEWRQLHKCRRQAKLNRLDRQTIDGVIDVALRPRSEDEIERGIEARTGIHDIKGLLQRWQYLRDTIEDQERVDGDITKPKRPGAPQS